MPPSGVWTATVPGAVAGWVAMKERFGTKSFSELLAPAIYYAENGVPINEITAEDWRRFEKALAEHPYSKATFLVNGERAPEFGEIWKNPDLARSLRRIAENGYDGLYKGATALAIVEKVKELGGAMALDDLADFRPEWVEPISLTYPAWVGYDFPSKTQLIVAPLIWNFL